MKKAISLLLAVVMLATFAVAAVAEPGVDSPVKPGTGVEVVPNTPGNSQNPTAGIVKDNSGNLLLQNSKGEDSGFHVVLDVNSNQSFVVGGYPTTPNQHINEIHDPVIKITFLNSSVKANENANPGDATDTSIGYDANQQAIDIFSGYMETVDNGGTVNDFLNSLNDTDAAGFKALLKKLGKEDAKFGLQDIFQVTMNDAAKDFCKGETSMPMTITMSENFSVDEGDAVIIAEVHGQGTGNEKVEYHEAEVIEAAKAAETNLHNAPAPKGCSLQFTFDLMNSGVFMVLAEQKADMPAADPSVGGGTVTSVVPGSSTSPKTGDLAEPVAEHSFPWAMVSVLCLAVVLGVSRLGKKEQ